MEISKGIPSNGGSRAYGELKKRKLFPSCGSVAVMALSRTISYLVVNSIFGLLVLALAKFLGLPVPINWITVLICALAGIPGAVLVLLLYSLGFDLPIIISLVTSRFYL